MVDCYGNWTFDPNDPEEKRNDMDRVALWVLQQGYTPLTSIENLTVVLMLRFEITFEAENRPYPDSEHLVEAISNFVFESGGIREFDYEP